MPERERRLQILDAPVPQSSWYSSSDLLTRSCPSSRLSTCPRSQKTSSSRAWSTAFHRLRNSWWGCRLSCPLLRFSSRLSSRSSTLQFRLVVMIMEVFLVFSQNKVLLLSRSLTILFRVVVGAQVVEVVEVFKVLSKDRIQQRLWCRTLTFQFLVVPLTIFMLFFCRQPHPQFRVMRLLQGFFRTFHEGKSARVAASPSARVPRHSFSRTQESSGFKSLRAARRCSETFWNPPEGLDRREVCGTGNLVSVLGCSHCLILAGGSRFEGLASPHTILGSMVSPIPATWPLLLWPRSSSTAAVTFSVVRILFGLWFLLSSTGPGCLASWQVWFRRKVMQLVALLCSLWLSSGDQKGSYA